MSQPETEKLQAVGGQDCCCFQATLLYNARAKAVSSPERGQKVERITVIKDVIE
jgi:hypothetical protein